MNFRLVGETLVNLDNILFLEKQGLTIRAFFSASAGDKLASKYLHGPAAEALWQELAGPSAMMQAGTNVPKA